MSLRVTTESTDHRPEPLDGRRALRRAWIWFLAIILCHVVLLVFHGWTRSSNVAPQIDNLASSRAFIANLFWVGFSGAAGFFLQEYFFRSYYNGQPVSPVNYLKGKLVVWTLLSSGAFVAVVLSHLSHSLFPHLVTCAIVYGFMATQYPQGGAMVWPYGDTDRAQFYAEPR